MNERQLYEFAEAHFKKKWQLNSLHQEDHFYPERALFTVTLRDLSEEFAEHMMTSYPALIRRELADQIGTMLRPRGKKWFNMAPVDPEREDDDAKRWLESATEIQRKAMYDPAAMLTRATKEADNDYVTFGQACMSSEIAWDDPKEGPHLLHRTWHLRDMAWAEDKYGRIGSRFRRWKPTARDLSRYFPGRVSTTVNNQATGTGQKPLTEVDVMHMVVESDMYDFDNPRGYPWVSIFYEYQNKHVIEAIPRWDPYYIIPRWQTVSGSQYAYSPATIVGLPDARLIQAMTRTLLEAGEKATNPPIVATEEVVRTDISLYAGGITWVDRDYDERLGDALRPISQDLRGIPIGNDMLQDSRQLIHAVFFLNKLNLPQRAPEMTAYEVGQRIQQYIRDALPIFEPMEMEYNGQLCEHDFELLQRAGAFGSPYDMPDSLQGARVEFRFSSPIHEAVEAEKASKFLEMKALLAEAVQMDESTLALPDAKVAFRDAMYAAGVPMRWVRDEATVEQIEEAKQAALQAQELLAGMETASKVAANLGQAQNQKQAVTP
jgi:hypothetical protein